MKSYRFSRRCYVQFAWSLYGSQGKRVALSMNRTNWKFGKTNINILTIGISWRGTTVSLIWVMLDKRGQPNQKERINTLIFILVLAFIWALKTSDYRK